MIELKKTSALQTIQLARGFAALLVVLFHCSAVFQLPKYFGYDPLGGTLLSGYAGVDLFFVISGFIIAHVHATDIGHWNAFPSFLNKRLWRIYPLYWVILLLVGLQLLFMGNLSAAIPYDASIIFKTIFLLPQNIDVIGGTGAPLIPVAWTLQHEMIFYLFFGIFILSPFIGCSTLLMASLLSLAFPEHYLAKFLANPLNLEFLMGILVWRLTRFKIRTMSAWLLLSTGLLLFVTMMMVDRTMMPVGNTPIELGFGLASACMLYGAVSLERSKGWKAPDILNLLGDASYSVYLVHFTVVSVACKMTLVLHQRWHVNTGLCYVLVVISAVFAGIAAYYFVEKPLIRFSKRYTSKNKTTMHSMQDRQHIQSNIKLAATPETVPR